MCRRGKIMSTYAATFYYKILCMHALTSLQIFAFAKKETRLKSAESAPFVIMQAEMGPMGIDKYQ